MYFLALWLVFSLAFRGNARDMDFCFADEDDPYLYMATKTSYHFVHGGKTKFQVVPNCEPRQIWMTSVYGTSYPTKTEIDDIFALKELQYHILANHEIRKNGRLCNRDLENLRRWKPHANLDTDTAEDLTPQGVEDMKLLARRLQSNFPELLQPDAINITSSNYKFRSLSTAGLQHSMEAFMEGLFGSSRAVTSEESSPDDVLLSKHKTCDTWNKPNSSFLNEELTNFEEDDAFKNLMLNVTRRLGFLYNISAHSIISMYNACRYEKAWTVTQLSPWCAVFSKQELRILEYREDLDYYYLAGYGRDINARLGCPLLQDIMHHFWKIQRQDDFDEPKAIFYFTDVVSFQNLLTTMGIAKDQKQLMARNYKEEARRNWRTSFISPFAANLVAVIYKCYDDHEPYKVMFYLAENPVMFEDCEVGLCSWQFVKSRFGSLAADCKTDICSKTNGVSHLSSSVLYLYATIFLVLSIFL